jgi:hypothetical protein
MEQPCYRCGQTVDEGIPFCPHCSAPQIRVMIAEPVPAAAPMADVAVPAQAEALPASHTVPVLALPMSWSDALRPCALAALVALVLVFLRLYPFVAMGCAGFLAVLFYRQRKPDRLINPRVGARLGILSGFLFFGAIALLLTLISTGQDFRAKLSAQILESAQQFAAAHPGYPEVQAAIEQLKTPEGMVRTLVTGCILFLVFSLLLAAVGGALGGAILGRRDKT